MSEEESLEEEQVISFRDNQLDRDVELGDADEVGVCVCVCEHTCQPGH